MNMNSHVKMKAQTERRPGCLGEQVTFRVSVRAFLSLTLCFNVFSKEEALKLSTMGLQSVKRRH